MICYVTYMQVQLDGATPSLFTAPRIWAGGAKKFGWSARRMWRRHSRWVASLLSRLLRAHSPSHQFDDEVVEDSDDEASASKKNTGKEDDEANNNLLGVARKVLAATKAGGSGAGTEGKVKRKGKKKVYDECVVYAILYYTWAICL
jgi:hypothetical protein